ncbi:MAG: hypothetical protein GY820_10935 [Gammaproteobacteria bacterium]|nr:hypothetical protein [Gammaproteobacteria bacterium]
MTNTQALTSRTTVCFVGRKGAMDTPYFTAAQEASETHHPYTTETDERTRTLTPLTHWETLRRPAPFHCCSAANNVCARPSLAYIVWMSARVRPSLLKTRVELGMHRAQPAAPASAHGRIC